MLRVLLLAATAGLLSSAIFEFGPLWLVALAAPAVLYGPYWAALVSTLGVGGLLIGKLRLERWLMLAILIILSLAASVLLTWTRSLAVVVAAQVVLGLVLAIVGIHASRLLHDAVPSSIRAGVSSGAGTLTWMLFLPFSLVFGWVAREEGVNSSGFMLGGAVVVLAILLIMSVRATRGVAPAEVAVTAKEEAVEVTERAGELACKQLVELVADYLEGALSPELKARFEAHLAGCDGCTTYLSQTQQIIAELRGLSAAPEERGVMQMILRYWRGWTTRGNAESYQRIVSEQVLPGIAARQLEGYHGAYLLRRDLDQEVEFATVMIFDSLDHVRAFAGEDYGNGLRPAALREPCSPVSTNNPPTTRRCLRPSRLADPLSGASVALRIPTPAQHMPAAMMRTRLQKGGMLWFRWNRLVGS